jgi:hypothetical protein
VVSDIAKPLGFQGRRDERGAVQRLFMRLTRALIKSVSNVDRDTSPPANPSFLLQRS